MKKTVCDFCDKHLVSHGSNGFIKVDIQVQGHISSLAHARNVFTYDLCKECGLPFIESAQEHLNNYLKKLNGDKTE